MCGAPAPWPPTPPPLHAWVGSPMASSGDEARRTAVARYQAALLQIRKQEANIATLQAELREQGRLFRKSEDDIKALQVRLARVGISMGAGQGPRVGGGLWRAIFPPPILQAHGCSRLTRARAHTPHTLSWGLRRAWGR